MAHNSKRIVIDQRSTHVSAKCEKCGWVTVDQRRLYKNVEAHRKSHGEKIRVVTRFSKDLEKTLKRLAELYTN